MMWMLRSTFALSGLLSLLFDGDGALACGVEVELRSAEFDADDAPDLQPDVRNVLEAIYDAAHEGDTDQARVMSDRLFERPLSDYEAAHAYRAAGVVYAEDQDLLPAVAAFEASLALGTLTPRDASDMHRDLARLRMDLEQPAAALEHLEAGYAIAPDPSEEDYWRIFWLRATLGRTREIEESIAETAQTSPEDASDLLGLASEIVDDAGGAVSLLDWGWLHGLLGPDEKVRLARLYLEQGDPYRAAALLERGLYDRAIAGNADHWLLLAESWLAAHDMGRALEPLRNAAEKAQDPALWLRLGRLHFDLREWPAAEEALHKALEGGAREARALLFAALFLQARFDAARALLAPPAPARSPALPSAEELGSAPACLGVHIVEIEEEEKAAEDGAWVGGVQPDSPALEAGLESGDRIVQFGARQIAGREDLIAEIRAARPGEGFALVVRRGERHEALHGISGAMLGSPGTCRATRSKGE